MSGNRLITQGMGPDTQNSGSSGMVASGLGGFFERVIDDFIVPAARLIVRAGNNARDYVTSRSDRIIVWARLKFINDEEPLRVVSGVTNSYKTKQHGARVELVSNKINVKNNITISVSRAKGYL